MTKSAQELDQVLKEAGMQVSAADRAICNRVTISGDSMSDTGNLNDDKMLLQMLIEMGKVAGTYENGTFTNGKPWVHTFAEKLVGRTVDVHPNTVELDNNEVLMRLFSKGGATAHDWKNEAWKSVVKKGAREMLTNLREMTEKCKTSDAQIGFTAGQKKRDLQIIWLGANDIITVNGEISDTSAILAATSIVKQIEEKRKQGYTNFVVMNLPDLSQTPRYKHADALEKSKLQGAVNRFNTQLKDGLDTLTRKDPQSNIKHFDMHAVFQTMLTNLERFGFRSEDEIWCEDGLHPQASAHALIGEIVAHFCQQHFQFAITPKHVEALTEEDALAMYRAQAAADLLQYPPKCCATPYEFETEKSLSNLFYHAIFEGGERTMRVLQEHLEWLDVRKSSAFFTCSEQPVFTCAVGSKVIEKAFNDAVTRAFSSDDSKVKARATAILHQERSITQHVLWTTQSHQVPVANSQSDIPRPM